MLQSIGVSIEKLTFVRGTDYQLSRYFKYIYNFEVIKFELYN